MFTLGACQYATGGDGYLSTRKRFVSKIYEYQKYDLVIENLTPLLDQFDADSDLAWAYLILGDSYFKRAEKDLAGQSTRKRMFGMMNEKPIHDLDMALECFDNAIFFDDGGEITEQALYSAGRVLDAGYLQRFEKAMEYYNRVLALSLTSEYGIKALERYRILSEWFGMYGPQ